MCKSSKTTSTNSVPGYVTDLSTSLASKAGDVLDKPFEAYTGDRVADFNADQQSAFQKLRDLIAGAPQVGGDAIQGAADYAKAPAQSIGTERIVDENGKLGAIADYLNPFQENVVSPALRKIQEQADAQRKRISAGATAAGSFGDARHGITEAMLGRDTSLAMGEIAGQLNKQGFDTAMGLRTGDVNRFKDVDALNANYDEQALQRMLTGTGAQLDRAKSDQDRLLGQISALLGAGTQQQGNEQSQLDAAYQEFMRKYIGDDATKIAAVTQALQGMKGAYDTTKTETKPDNSLLGAAGSAAGAAASSPAFWSFLAAI